MMTKATRLGFTILAILCCVLTLSAQNLDWNITGAGARAEGIGGAFIGVADDATSIVWNPAGLATLEKPEASLVTRFISESADYTDLFNATNNNSQSQSHFSLNFGSFALPLKAGGNNIVVAVAYQRQLDLYSKSKNALYDQERSGGANTITPGVGVKLSPAISVGLAVNIWTGSYSGTLKTTYLGSPATSTDDASFSGLNFGIGALLDLGGLQSRVPLKIGLSIKTPFDLKIDNSNQTTVGTLSSKVTQTITGQMPMMIGFGASYQPSDNLLFAVDYEIRSFKDKTYTTTYSDNSPQVTGKMSDSNENLNQFRVGAEYLIVTSSAVVPLRVGYRSVPTVLANVDNAGNPTSQVSGSGFSVGSGYVADRFALDLTYSNASYEQSQDQVGSIKYATSTLSASIIFYF